jgi:hypothetical protein
MMGPFGSGTGCAQSPLESGCVGVDGWAFPGGERPWWWIGGVLVREWFPAAAEGGWITVECDRIITQVMDQRGPRITPGSQVRPIGTEIIERLADLVEFGPKLAADLLIRVGGVILDLPYSFGEPGRGGGQSLRAEHQQRYHGQDEQFFQAQVKKR